MPLPKATLERLIEVSPDIVVATDSAGTVAFYNTGARDNLGWDPDEIIGRYVADLYPSADEAKRVMAAMRGIAHGGAGRCVSFPTRFRAKDGHVISVAISGVILRDTNGDEQGTIGFAKDTSEMHREDQLAVLAEVAIGLSHEINNPLTVIANHVNLLEREAADRGDHDGMRRFVAIRAEVNRIERHLRNLTQMADQGTAYEATDYVGAVRMIDMSQSDAKTGKPFSGRHMLVVDDDDAVRESVVETLEADGATVDSACNGREAIELIEQNRYDLIVSDVVMPEMDGYELLLEVRRRWPETAIVLMTAFYFDKNHVIKRSRLEGVSEVVFKKPLDPDNLRKRLVAILEADGA